MQYDKTNTRTYYIIAYKNVNVAEVLKINTKKKFYIAVNGTYNCLNLMEIESLYFLCF